MKRVYVGIEEITRPEAEEAFRSGDTSRICHALVNIVHSDDDWVWLQGLCVQFITDADLSTEPLSEKDRNIAGLAITCLGHIARLHGALDLAVVLPVLEYAQRNRELAGRVETAMDDMEVFLLPKGSFRRP